MNKIEAVPQMDGKPLEELTEVEKKQPTQSLPTLDDDLEQKPTDNGEGDPVTNPEVKPEGEPVVEQVSIEQPTPEATPEVSVNPEEDPVLRGLESEQDKLQAQVRDNIVLLRSQRRQQKYDLEHPKTTEVQDDLDEDVSEKIDAHLSNKGIVSREEIKAEFQHESLLKGMREADEKFLSEYPEYLRSTELQQEHQSILDNLQKPSSSEQYQQQLEIANSMVQKNNPDKFPTSSSGTIASKKQALETASLGTVGKSNPSISQPTYDPTKVEMLRRGGGWSEEEIRDLSKNN